MLEHLQRIRKRGVLEKDPVIAGALLTMMDPRTVLHRDMAEIAQEHLGAHIHFFQTRIERSIQIAEAQFYGKSMEAYNPKGKGAIAYAALAEEIMAGNHQVRVSTLNVPAGFADSLLQVATAVEEQVEDGGAEFTLEEVHIG